jgi:hypothetical protein
MRRYSKGFTHHESTPVRQKKRFNKAMKAAKKAEMMTYNCR